MSDYFEFHIVTSDGLELFGQDWKPEGKPAGVVCLIHGLGEHSSRYTCLAETIRDAGYGFLAFDLRGHGRSQGKRGHVASYEVLLDDISLLLKEAQQRYLRSPIFLYGHSMGGGLVLNYALRRNFPLAGVIASAPMLRLGFEPPATKITLAKLMNAIWPTFSQASDLDTKALSRDPDVVQRYEADPLVHDRVSARLFFAFYRAGLWALENVDKISVPTLLMHGSDDKLTAPEASQLFVNRDGDLCTFKRWEGFYHELHNEPEHDQVFAFVLDWLQQIQSMELEN